MAIRYPLDTRLETVSYFDMIMSQKGIYTRREFLRNTILTASAITFAGYAGATIVKHPFNVALNLDFLSDKLTLMRRKDWADISPDIWRMRLAGFYDRLTVHHAGSSVNFHTDINTVIYDLESIFAAHRDRNYGDIGYHFIIDYAGRVWEGRSLIYEGAHVSGQNERNIGVMLIGNFEKQAPSKKQLSSMKILIALLKKQYRIKQYRIYGHRDLGYTICPGKNLYQYVEKLKF